MKTEIVKLSQIATNDHNPRQISPDKFHKLVLSLLVLPKMLEIRPIVVDSQMVALGGNMRCRALNHIATLDDDEMALALSQSHDFEKKTEAERDRLLEFWANWRQNPTAHIIKADELTEAEKREFVIKDNVGFGEWDMDMLANEWDMEELQDWGLDFNFDEEEQEEEAKEDDMSEEEMANAPTRCKTGDVWNLGRHRLMCGDSTDPEAVAVLMDGQLADLWLTDPPYNVNYQGGTEDKLKIANDNMEDAAFHDFLVAAYKAADSAMRQGAAFYIWHADSEGYNFRSAVKDAGWTLRQCLIWVKSSLVLGRQDYQWRHEPCLYGWKEGAAHYFCNHRDLTTVIEDRVNIAKMKKEEMRALLEKILDPENPTTVLHYDKPLRNGEHPTMKPVGLFGYLINNSTKKGDRVLDTFGGSGTTIIACEQLGRTAYTMELDPHYCDVILERWEKLTGATAERVRTISNDE